MSRALRAGPYNACTRKCDVCLTEKIPITKADPSSLLDTRDEFISKCRHEQIYFKIFSKSVNGNHVAKVKLSYSKS